MRLGWNIKRHDKTSHRVLEREGWPDYVFACDAYIAPFVRLRRLVVPGWDPRIFVKFGFPNFGDARLSITSFHEENS